VSELEARLPRPLVAVLRSARSERVVDVGRVLVDAGLPAVEVTLTIPGAVECIAALRRALPPGAVVGAGTVRTVEQLHRAADAGAHFAVSQVTSAEVLAAGRERGLPVVPGALTPNEIVAAWSAGVELVKVSPVGPVGGVDYVRELVGPLPEVRLFPTGGVTLADAPAYLDAGAALVGVSRHLLLDALEPGGDLDALRERTTALVDSIDRRARAAGGAA